MLNPRTGQRIRRKFDRGLYKRKWSQCGSHENVRVNVQRLRFGNAAIGLVLDWNLEGKRSRRVQRWMDVMERDSYTRSAEFERYAGPREILVIKR